MARPKTKQDLIQNGNESFKKLWDLIDSIGLEAQTKPFGFNPEAMGKEAHWARDKNLRDVLIHLYEWHELLLNWVEGNQKGNDRPFLPEPYNWKTYGEMNVMFWEKHQTTAYSESQRLVKNSHDQVMKLIETFSNEALFTKNYFNWTGGSTLGQYCISTTVGHYDWAIKKIKAHIKNL